MLAQRWTRLPLLLAVLALVLTACPDDEPAADDNGEDAPEGAIPEQFDLGDADITVGSKEFTEQLILGYLALEALEAAGATVNDEIGLGGTGEVRAALEAGEIDLYWEYTGTGWITHLGEVDPVPGAHEQYDAVAERDREENGIVWLAPAEPDNTYALALSPDSHDELGVDTISELVDLIEEQPDEVTFCGTDEFMVREDGLPGLAEHYGFEVPGGSTTEMDPGIMYSEVVDNPDQCRFAAVFATDGRIAARDLVVLEEFFPVYQPSVNVREEVFDQWPELEDLFALVVEDLDTETLQQMNADVDEVGLEPRDVAAEYLQEHGLIP
jgi:osmoprotectant transport system substrate-binding protein